MRDRAARIMLLLSVLIFLSIYGIIQLQEWVEKKINFNTDYDYIDTEVIFANGSDSSRPPLPIVEFDLKPFFPIEAKEANITEKTVVVLVQIDEIGQLKSAKIASGKAGYGFDEAALRIINKARFSPGYLNGKPVKMQHRIPINFTLDE